VVKGYLSLSGNVSVRTTALAEDYVVAKMAKLVEEAQNSKSKTQRFIDKFAQYYTPITHPVLKAFTEVEYRERVFEQPFTSFV
jgi:Cd2+/Zn2+-exporting ATPase